MERLRVVVRPRRRGLIASAIVVILAVGAGLLWFQPWKLVVDETVNEPVPLVSPSASTTPSARELARGAFRSLEHETRGRARILVLPDGSRVVRFEGFETSNGPDLIVLLSASRATESDWRAYDDGAVVSLGRLKGNVGNQNYRIPASVELSRYRSVVVWCRRFTVGFGAAPIA